MRPACVLSARLRACRAPSDPAPCGPRGWRTETPTDGAWEGTDVAVAAAPSSQRGSSLAARPFVAAACACPHSPRGALGALGAAPGLGASHLGRVCLLPAAPHRLWLSPQWPRAGPLPSLTSARGLGRVPVQAQSAGHARAPGRLPRREGGRAPVNVLSCPLGFSWVGCELGGLLGDFFPAFLILFS